MKGAGMGKQECEEQGWEKRNVRSRDGKTEM